jgi:putative ATPase
VAAFQACHFIGMPECTVHLAEAVIYLSVAPKSNAAYIAYEHAKRDALEHTAEPVPLALRNAPTRLMKDLGYGKGYRLAHYEENKIADLQCLPDGLEGREYYVPTDQGVEARVKARLDQIKAWKAELKRRRPGGGPPGSA